MKRPDPGVYQSFARMTRQFPDIVDYLEAAYRQELEQLPSVAARIEVAQGRCLVLKELCELVKNAQNTVA